jgi:hypothetical protein
MRPRYLPFFALAVLLVGMFFSGFAYVRAQGMPGEGMGMHGYGDQLPPGLAFLSSIPKEQRFDHFRGGSMKITDAQGTEHTLTMTPGKVQAVTAQQITVVPNGSAAAHNFNITTNTRVVGRPNQGSNQVLAPQDKVMVLTVDDSADAVMVHKYTPRPAMPKTTPTPTP